MELKEILERNILDFPIAIDTTNIITELRKKYKEHIKYLRSIKDTNPNLIITDSDIGKVKKIGDNLLRIFKYYLSGNLHGAYLSFNNVMKLAKDNLDYFRLTDRKPEYLPITELYRFRISKKNYIEKSEIFHVPLSKRKSINSYRFSIPGLPALYLGTSIYICWEEMSRPTFDDVHVSSFQFDNEIETSILNISFTNKLLLEYLDHLNEDKLDESIISKKLKDSINKYLLIWPLLAACQIKVTDKDTPFKPEYIVPQILMQYISQKDNFDGILYTSTRVAATYVSPSKCLNLVLPLKKEERNGEYCKKLRSSLKFTEPVSLKILKTIINKGNPPYEEDFEIAKGIRINYVNTDFGFFESKLVKQEKDFF